MFAPLPSTATFTAAQVRAAELPLLKQQAFDDELMRQAAHAVAVVAEGMADADTRILLLVGPGGNGGDALYAGAELVARGYRVAAKLVYGKAHQRALAAYVKAGGTLVEEAAEDYGLIIDGVFGIGGHGGLSEPMQVGRAQVLSIDVPSGINADTGECADFHITADVTVTFGGWRRAHAVAPECGLQLLSRDLSIGSLSLSEQLEAGQQGKPGITAFRAIKPASAFPPGIVTMERYPVASVEPGPYDDKYSGGVVGIRAGSSKYPGAALLCVAGAVTATPSMVRYAGPHAGDVVRAWPEVVVSAQVEQAGRVQAWVVGPGAGLDEGAQHDLAWILQQPVPVLLDADALTLLAQNSHFRNLVQDRSETTVLTPHSGEFSRLWTAIFDVPEPDCVSATQRLAARLGVIVLRKGRHSIVANGYNGETSIIDAGNSSAATPGSGDVLAGICGARMARHESHEAVQNAVLEAVTIHAVAADLSAQTAFGRGPTHASKIAHHVSAATADVTVKLSTLRRKPQ